MSYINGVYTNPGWSNNNPPALNAQNLNDISNALQDAALVGNLNNMYGWKKYLITPASTSETPNPTALELLGGSSSRSWSYSSSVSINDDGGISLSSPTQSISITSSITATTITNALNGKYIQMSGLSTGTIYRVDGNATVDKTQSSSRYITISPTYIVSGLSRQATLVDTPISTNENAYPKDGESGGYYYQYSGTLANVNSIETGNYIGTGSYPVTITFSKKPQIILLGLNRGGDAGDFIALMPLIGGNVVEYGSASSAARSITYTWADNSLVLSYSSTSSSPLNKSGTTYHYFAIS